MSYTYIKTTWRNGQEPGISAEQLNRMEQGIADAIDGVNAQEAGKQDTLTFDTVPTLNSLNPVTSGGIKQAIDAKADLNSPEFTGVPIVPTPLDTIVTGQAVNVEYVEGVAARIEQDIDEVVEVQDTILQETIPGITDRIALVEGDTSYALSELPNKANIDGAYEGMSVGTAEQLISTVVKEDKVPYHFRQSGGNIDVGNREANTIIGGTLVWNQLVDTNTTSVSVPSGHKVYTKINGVKNVVASTGTISASGSASDLVVDLTVLFGVAIADHFYTMEQSNPGTGAALFDQLFPYLLYEDDYAYNPGELVNVTGLTAHKMTGFNAFDGLGALVVGGYAYQITGVYTVLTIDDVQITPDANGVFTAPTTGHIDVMGGGADTCIHLVLSGARNGDYEEYDVHTVPLDSTLTLRGIPKLDAVGNIYYDGDVYRSDGVVERKYEQRPYQAGDESLADAITDGTTTVVKLAAPVMEQATPYQNPQIVDDWGTEQYDSTSIVPVGHETVYMANLRDKLQHLPNLSNADGDYIVRQVGVQMSLVPLTDVKELPDAPTADGIYHLQVTVVDGEAVYSWEAE